MKIYVTPIMVYGENRFRINDAIQQKAVQHLTQKQTISQCDISALKKLGFDVCLPSHAETSL